MRRTVKTGLWVLAGSFLLLVVLATAAILYLAHHPSHIRDVLVRSASQATGMRVGVRSLEWSLKPLRIRASGIKVTPRDADSDSVALTLDEIAADLSLEGPLGDRTLVIEEIRAQGFDATVQGRPTLPGGTGGRDRPSWLARAGVALLHKLLFRDLRIERGELTQARITANTDAAFVRADGLSIALASNGDLKAETSVHLVLPDTGTTLDLPDIRLQTALPKQKNPTEPIQGRVQGDHGTLKTPTGVLQGLFFQAKLLLEPGRGSVRIAPFEAGTGDLRPLLPLALPDPVNARATISSYLHLKENRLERGPFQVSLQTPSLEIPLKGHLQGSWGPGFRLSIEDLECRLLPELLVPQLPKNLGKRIASMSVDGGISLSGAVTVRTDEDTVRIRPDLALRLEENEVQWELPQGKAGGCISGDVRISGAWPGLSTACAIRGEEVYLDHPSLQTANATAVMRVSGPVSDLRLQEFDIRAPQVRIGPSEAPLLLPVFHVQASAGNLDPLQGTLQLPEITAGFDDQAMFYIRILVQPGETNLSIHGEDLNLLPLLSQEGGPLAGWNPQGRNRLRIQAKRNGDRPWSLSSRITFEGLSVENPDAELYGEDLAAVFTLDGHVETNPAAFSGASSLEASAGELLLDRFYLNLEKNPLSLQYRGTMIPGARAVHIANLEAGLAQLLNAKASGRFQDTPTGLQAALSISIPSFPLAPAFLQFVAEPFRMHSPLLQNLTVEGKGSGDFEITVEEAQTAVLGRIRVQEGTVSNEASSFAFKGVDLSLPFVYRDEEPAGPMQPPGEGRVSIASMRLALLPEQPLDIRLEAEPNRLRVPGPIRVRIPGGEVRLATLQLAYTTERGFRAETAVTLDNVALHPLLSRLWPGSPQGNLSGNLDPIQYAEGRMQSGGHMRAELFDGHVTLERIGISRLFSAGPLLRLHARWEGLNLDPMTTGTPFGRVTGLLRGHLKDFEMAYGQPQRFDLLLETVPRQDVKQKISVKAVDNIARIGGGGSPFVGMAGFFTSLFREFPYEKIGVHALLQNDVFQINGTIRDEGKEYLVKRSGFSGVNVVNQNPDNRIRFKDMVKRIQRITASRSGPVIR